MKLTGEREKFVRKYFNISALLCSAHCSPVKEILEMPPRNHTAFPHAGLLYIGGTKQLHPHHGKYEDDDDQDEGQVGQGPQCGLHDAEDVVERLPRLGQLEDSQQTERSEH